MAFASEAPLGRAVGLVLLAVYFSPATGLLMEVSMTRMVLTVLAVLAISGSAFAQSQAELDTALLAAPAPL